MSKRLLCMIYIMVMMLLVSSCFQEKDILSQEEKEWLRNNPGLTVAVSPKYPPYQFINPEGKIDGIFIDFFNSIEKKINYKFEKVFYQNWQPIMSDAKNKKIDAIIEIQKTEERSLFLNFTPPLFIHPHVVVSRAESPEQIQLEDFYNKPVSVVNTYAIHEYLKTSHPQLKLNPKPNDIGCFKALISGEVDAYIGQKSIAMYLINRYGDDRFRIVADVDYINQLGLATRKDLVLLNTILVKAINSITDTERQRILEKRIFTTIKPFYQKVSFWVSILAVTVLLSVSGMVFYFVLRKRIKIKSKKLKNAKTNIEKNNQLKTAFLTNIYSEIRTPLEGISSFSHLLEEKQITNEKRKQYAKIIINSGKQIISSISDVLEVSKTNCQIRLNPEETDLHEVIETCFAIGRMKADKKNISIVLENLIPEDLEQVIMDKSKLIKIVNNLLENTIKSSNEDTITMMCRIRGFSLIIRVRDSKIGLNKSNKNQRVVFKSFAQSEKQISQKYGGLGVELSISKTNVDLMGGAISFAYHPDKRSAFEITLPYRPVSANIERVSKDITKNSSSSTHSILIAEDGNVNFLFLKTLLMKIPEYNFSILRAKNGKEAVDFCKQEKRVDLVFMDIRMPIMDGYQATQMIKELRPELPVIAQTAHSGEEDIRNAYSVGCDNFIPKPVNLKIVRVLLKKYLPIIHIETII